MSPENSLPFIREYDRENAAHREAFSRLNREWLERHFYVEEQDEEVFADPEGTVLAIGGVILLVEDGGLLVGTGSLFPLEPGCYEIAKMAVTQSHQGRGIGERMLKALIDRAHSLGAGKLFIVSNTKLDRALRLYRRHGFTDSPENRHVHYVRGNITLEKSLADL